MVGCTQDVFDKSRRRPFVVPVLVGVSITTVCTLSIAFSDGLTSLILMLIYLPGLLVAGGVGGYLSVTDSRYGAFIGGVIGVLTSLVVLAGIFVLSYDPSPSPPWSSSDHPGPMGGVGVTTVLFALSLSLLVTVVTYASVFGGVLGTAIRRRVRPSDESGPRLGTLPGELESGRIPISNAFVAGSLVVPVSAFGATSAYLVFPGVLQASFALVGSLAVLFSGGLAAVLERCSWRRGAATGALAASVVLVLFSVLFVAPLGLVILLYGTSIGDIPDVFSTNAMTHVSFALGFFPAVFYTIVLGALGGVLGSLFSASIQTR